MVFVDDVGGKWHHINHSPWDDFTLADFVMPWFLFIIGTAMAFNFKKFMKDNETKKAGTKFALIRALKLYFLGVLIQGGNWFGDNNYSYGWNLATIRYCGILNRIAWAYWIVALCELWLPKRSPSEDSNPHISLFVTHIWGWVVSSLFVILYLILTFATYVPTW